MTLFGYNISQLAAGILLGAILYHFVIRSLSGLFSQLGRFDDYSSRRDYRRRRSNNGFILFLLAIAAALVLAKMLSDGSLSIGDQKIWKDAIPAVTHDQPTPPPPPARRVGTGEGASLYPPPEYVYPEKENTSRKESEEDLPSTERYFVQTDCLDELDSAQERAESLHQTHGLPTGVMKKEIDGSIKYAPFLGPFDSRSEAEDVNQQCCKLKGWVQPYRNIDEISW